ncbi:MAG: amidohydrolase, partial [Verrucomicrobiales bacterium]|nr:amidohydrolase [Verrucomicrobiales bacterium]
KLADVLVVDGDVLADISILENRDNFIAIFQGGEVKAGQVAPRHQAQIPAIG